MKDIKMKMCRNLVRTNLPVIKIKNNFLRKTIKCFAGVYILLIKRKQVFTILIKDVLFLSQLDIVLTTKCTLRCKYCSDLMPYFTRPFDMDFDYLIQTFSELLKAVDYIDEIRLLGGEPFLYKKLDKVIEYFSASNQIGKICIYTNGTLMPRGEQLIKSLKEKKVEIVISDYGKYSTKVKDIEAVCKTEKIKYKTTFLPYWLDFGNMDERVRTTTELEDQFRKCNTMCHSYLNGKYFYCERSASGITLGLVPEADDDYVDLMDQNISLEEKRKQLIYLSFYKNYIECCRRCDKGTANAKVVSVAEQIGRDEEV